MNTKSSDPKHPNSFNARQSIRVNNKSFSFFSLAQAQKHGLPDVQTLPFCLRVLLENLLRHEDNSSVTRDDVLALAQPQQSSQPREIAFRPARVLLQDFTGVPAVADLAAMRDALQQQNQNPQSVNPLIPVDLVIDHSVMVDRFGSPNALQYNVQREHQRNHERYAFLRWGANAFKNLRVVPPGTGICHQVNLEHLADVVVSRNNSLFPDTLVGADSHTTMINALGVLGWGVGGVEAEAAMLGQPLSMLIPETVGVKLLGSLQHGATATDLVLHITEALRNEGVVGSFVEFYGPGLDLLPLEDRATISNMSPEYGATCGFFPIDNATISYLRATGRPESLISRVETYAKAQLLWRNPDAPDPSYSRLVQISLNDVVPSLAGPRRPQDRVAVTNAAQSFKNALINDFNVSPQNADNPINIDEHVVRHGDVALAAITSCTNTSNPSAMIGAGLLAKNAVSLGMSVKNGVKTSLAPGSQVVADYLKRAQLMPYLEKLGFHIAGFGCTTCIGNSGPLPDHFARASKENNVVLAAVLSGNRNFESRISPDVRANYLASPMLVVAYALAGSMRVNLAEDPVGHDKDENPVFLRDLQPSPDDIAVALREALSPSLFQSRYKDAYNGDDTWRSLPLDSSPAYPWNPKSTYVQQPPFPAMTEQSLPVQNARVLALLGDSVTTDHISPAGSIAANSPAGEYLQKNGVKPVDFNSYGARRGNHHVMARGAFANTQLQNAMTPDKRGGFTKLMPDDEETSIHHAAETYAQRNVPLVVLAGSLYGTGSSRDWAAKGPKLLGVRVVIARSFERIHRSNLVCMGILPLEFADNDNSWESLGFNGSEILSFPDFTNPTPRQTVNVLVQKSDGTSFSFPASSRIDTDAEVKYFLAGGVLPFVLNHMADA